MGPKKKLNVDFAEDAGFELNPGLDEEPEKAVRPNYEKTYDEIRQEKVLVLCL